MPPPILLYDGVCGLCNRLVQFVLRRDQEKIFRFASLQSALARRILARHGVNAGDLDAVYVVTDYHASREEYPKKDQAKERLLARSDAAILILQQIGGFWRVTALISRLIPRPVRDCGYGLIARNRYRIWGRYGTCPPPAEETRGRFLDV